MHSSRAPAAQPDAAEVEMALQMSEQHLDLAAFAGRLFNRSGMPLPEATIAYAAAKAC